MCRLVFQANSNSFLHFILGSIALLCFAPPVKKRRKRKGETLSFSLSSFPFPSGLRFLDLALGDTAGARESPNTFCSENVFCTLIVLLFMGKRKNFLGRILPQNKHLPCHPAKRELSQHSPFPSHTGKVFFAPSSLPSLWFGLGSMGGGGLQGAQYPQLEEELIETVSVTPLLMRVDTTTTDLSD